MTALVELETSPVLPPVLRTPPRWARWAEWARAQPVVFGSAVFVLFNAIAFLCVQPGVNDLWAARARANAVSHGVGLTYWFAWFGGGSTPGNYSVITPYLSALFTAEAVGAIAALAVTILSAVALRGTRHAAAATAVAGLAAAINLWSGRVPFLLGAALGVAAIVAVRADRRWLAVAFTVASILATPTTGAVLALGLAGLVLTRSRYRTIAISVIVTAAITLGLVALAFGAPGPQKFGWFLCGEMIAALLLFLYARPPDHLRVVVWLSILVALGIAVVPNGMGSNFGRMVWFCLPVVIVATSARRVWMVLVLIAPVVLSGAKLTINDLAQAGQPTAARAYYMPLANQLDTIGELNNYRVEVVSLGAHAAYDALLDHAMLARGWETQEDNALNPTLKDRKSLDPTSYKIWLDNNSVGYVAFPQSKAETYPEYQLVAHGLPYLHQIWSSPDWLLYRVSNPVPIVSSPQSVLAYAQATLTIRTTCACTFTVRIHYSKYLKATPVPGQNGKAQVTADHYGFTSVQTSGPGDYVLHGSVTGLFH